MLGLILRLVLDPTLAPYVGAALAGEPSFGPHLARICMRESQGLPIGVHPDDAGRSRQVWTDAVRAGLVDPTCQPHERGAWSTRGIAGTMAAYTVHHLPGRCWPPEVLDLPLVAAFAATRRATHPRCRQVRACRHWRGW